MMTLYFYHNLLLSLSLITYHCHLIDPHGFFGVFFKKYKFKKDKAQIAEILRNM